MTRVPGAQTGTEPHGSSWQGVGSLGGASPSLEVRWQESHSRQTAHVPELLRPWDTYQNAGADLSMGTPEQRLAGQPGG